MGGTCCSYASDDV
jgi:hypothetical protein